MAGVKDPAKGLGQVIQGIDDARDVLRDNVASILPILNGKMLDINVTGALGRDASVDHVDSRHVVFVDWGGTGLGKTEFEEDRAKVLRMFSCDNCSQKFGFSGAGGCDGLGLSAVRNGTTTEDKGVSGSRTSFTEVIGMSSIDVASQFRRGRRFRERRQVGLGGQRLVSDRNT